MKKSSFVLTMAFMVVHCGFAEDVSVIGNYVRTNVSVAAGQTVTEQAPLLFTTLAGALDLTGLGTYQLPLGNGLAHGADGFSINVRSGSFAAQTGGSFPDLTATPPAVIGRDAAMWLDAEAENSFIAQDADANADRVLWWRDCRETKASAPFDYWAGEGRTNSLDKTKVFGQWLPRRETIFGRDAVYFNGCNGNNPSAKNNAEALQKIKDGTWKNVGTWMGFTKPGNTETKSATYMSVAHLFVACCYTNTSGYMVGTFGGSLPICPDSVLVANTTIQTAGNNSQIPGYVGRIYKNGVLTDQNVDTYDKNKIQVLEYEFCGPLCDVGAFFCERGYNALTLNGDAMFREGGDFICEAIAFTNRLDETDRALVGEYLMQKWLADRPVQPCNVHVAQGATLTLDSAQAETVTDGRLAVDGDVTLSKVGSAAASVRHVWPKPLRDVFYPDYFFGGTNAAFRTEEGTLNLETAEVPYAFRAGEKVNANEGHYAVALTKTDLAEPGTVQLAGNATVRMGKVPAGTDTIKVDGGELVLSAETLDESPILPGTTGAVALDKTSFQVNAGNARSITVSFTVTEPGPYELSFVQKSDNASSDSHGVDIELKAGDVTIDSTRTTTYRDSVSVPNEWRRFLFRDVPAGKLNLVFTTRCEGTAQASTFSKLEFRAVAERMENVIPVTNGDFEKSVWPTACVVTKDSAADGWTFDHGGLDSDVPSIAVQTPGTWMFHASSSDYAAGKVTPAADGSRPFARAFSGGIRYGGTQLMIYSTNGVASSPVTRLPAGTYKLRAKLARWSTGTGRWYAEASQSNGRCNAKNHNVRAWACFGGKEVSLNTLAAPGRNFNEMEFPDSFTLTEPTDVVVKLQGRTSHSAVVLDDLVFVPQDGSAGDLGPELIRNGSFETSADGSTSWAKDWSRVRISNEKGQAIQVGERSGPVSVNFGSTYCDGGYAMRLAAANTTWAEGDPAIGGWCTQSVTFAESGDYRLSFWSRARIDNGSWYTSPHIVVWMFRNDDPSKTNEICRTFGPLQGSNFTCRVSGFRVPTAGDWTIGIQGVEGGARDCLVDLVSVRKVNRQGALPDLANVAVDVAAGAKLRLDYFGTVRAQHVRIGGRSYSGLISSARFPSSVTGPGEIYVEPKGLYILIK